MHIDDITNSQLILLVLLIVFVTSAATTIVVVSVLGSDKTTSGVSSIKTLNRIIERTVEREVAVGSEPEENEIIHLADILLESDLVFLMNLVNSEKSHSVVEEIRKSTTPLTTLDGESIGYGFLIGNSKKRILKTSNLPYSEAHIDSISGEIGSIRSGDEDYSIIDFEEEINLSNLSVADNSKLDVGMVVYGYEKTGEIERFVAGVIYEVIKDSDGVVEYFLPSFYADMINPGSIILNSEAEFIGLIQESSGEVSFVDF